MLVSLALRGGLVGFDRPLGAVDLAHLPSPIAEQAREQLTHLHELAQAEAPETRADALRYEVALHGEDGSALPITVFDEGDWERPAQQALAQLAGTLGLPLN